MSNALTTLRQSIVTQLTAKGFHAFDHLPERITPPFAFVGPREPYVTHNQADFGQEFVNHQVILVTGKGTNDAAAEDLDQMIVDALTALDDGFQTQDVGQPGQIKIGSGAYLAVTIDLQNEVTL